MARTPTSIISSAGRKRAAAEAGFTLVELLVVLALLALAYGLAAPALTQAVTGSDLRRETRELEAALARARAGALTGGKPQRILVDGLAGAYAVGGSRHALTGGIIIAASVPDSRRLSAHQAVIEFFPDGSSTGGRMTLSSPSGGKSALTVDWLTGRVMPAQ